VWVQTQKHILLCAILWDKKSRVNAKVLDVGWSLLCYLA